MSRYPPFEIVKELEWQICHYTGAPFCVVVNSCTNAIGICLEYHKDQLGSKHEYINIPKFTYIGVPMQIKRAGFDVTFREEDWKGEYDLYPFDIWDSARRFRKDMWFENGSTKCYDVMGHKYKCVSFHRTKILHHSQGGAIIHNNHDFQNYAEMMRFDGRTPGGLAQNDNPTVLGRHCYMDPEVAAALLHNLYYLPDHSEDLPNSPYPDLSKLDIFK